MTWARTSQAQIVIKIVSMISGWNVEAQTELLIHDLVEPVLVSLEADMTPSYRLYGSAVGDNAQRSTDTFHCEDMESFFCDSATNNDRATT